MHRYGQELLLPKSLEFSSSFTKYYYQEFYSLLKNPIPFVQFGGEIAFPLALTGRKYYFHEPSRSNSRTISTHSACASRVPMTKYLCSVPVRKDLYSLLKNRIPFVHKNPIPFVHLLYGHALCQISWLVYVQAASSGDVIGQQL